MDNVLYNLIEHSLSMCYDKLETWIMFYIIYRTFKYPCAVIRHGYSRVIRKYFWIGEGGGGGGGGEGEGSDLRLMSGQAYSLLYLA